MQVGIAAGMGLTDDPTVGGATDPTSFAILAAAIPTLSGWMLMLLAVTVAFAGALKLRS